MIGPLARISNKLGRNAMTNFVRAHSHGGVPGEYISESDQTKVIMCILPYDLQNLPFDIHNRYKLTAFFIVFIGSGLSAPYLICRHQLLKK